ncbi:MAG: hypothetical protein HYV28_01825 [Ignavibacteriales bacterium]|nr:hypothetical protein [Ignavibacteriales bacterium]
MLKYFHFLFQFKTILVAALLFNAFGTQFVYWKLNRVAKLEMRQKMVGVITSSEITRLAFHKSKPVQLIDNGKEILLDERKYDIVRISSTVDSVVYYCLHDSVETRLLAGYKKAFLNDQAGGKSGRSLKNILLNELQAGVLNASVLAGCYFNSILYWSGNDVVKQQFSISLPDPPPKS